MIQKDVLIVGGGPAGAACAWRLQQSGLDCLILDKASFPRYKLCAGWVNPSLFRSLEITPDAYPHVLTRYSTFIFSIKGVKIHLKTQQYAIRRWEFDEWLLKRSGVESVVHQVENIELDGDGYIIDDQYRAKFLVGAGGTHCPIRRSLFASQTPLHTKGLIIAKEEEFQYPLKDDRCHVWFFDDGLSGYGWYFPKADGHLNVGIGGTAAGLKAKGQTLNQHWERFIHQLDEQGLVTGHDFAPMGSSYYLRSGSLEPRRGNAFLVGDALGMATLDMGEGITPSVQSGLLAAEAIATGKPYTPHRIPRYSLPSILRLRR